MSPFRSLATPPTAGQFPEVRIVSGFADSTVHGLRPKGILRQGLALSRGFLPLSSSHDHDHQQVMGQGLTRGWGGRLRPEACSSSASCPAGLWAGSPTRM